MPKHIRGRATPKPTKSVRPFRVSLWRPPTSSRRLPDALASRFAPFLVDRYARGETELPPSSWKGL